METEYQNIEAILNKFLIAHRDGVKKRYVYGRNKWINGKQKYIPGHYTTSSPLTKAEVDQLTAFVNNDPIKLNQTLDQHQPFKDHIQNLTDQIARTLFDGLKKLKTARDTEERKRILKEKQRLETLQKREANKLAQRLRQEEASSKRLELRAKLKLARDIKLQQQRAEAKRLKKKAEEKGKKRSALWKELQLSAEQKKVFKKLATL